MIAPYNSSSSVNAGIDGALKPEWTSACLVTNATKVQRRMVRVVTDIGCAFFVARAHRRVAPLDDAPFSEDFFY